jgi:pimeloyl-ACP methyl ester carboxylesterase
MALEVKELDHITLYEAAPSNPRDDTTYFLLDGIGTSLDFWVAVAPLLAEDNRTIAIDIPGFGRSSPARTGPYLSPLAPGGRLLQQQMKDDKLDSCLR